MQSHIAASRILIAQAILCTAHRRLCRPQAAKSFPIQWRFVPPDQQRKKRKVAAHVLSSMRQYRPWQLWMS